MEKIKEELQNLINLYSDKDKLRELNENIKEKKSELDNLNSKVQLQISGTPLRDIAQEEFEVAKKEFEKMQKDKNYKQKELNEKFEEYKNSLVSKIEEEMKKYKRKSELDHLKSSRDAYERIANNAEKTVKRLISDLNDGKNIDQSMLISARKEMNDNKERSEQVEKELKGYIEIDSNIEQYSDLEYLKTRMQGLTLEQLNEKTEKEFYKKYFENTKSEPTKPEPTEPETTEPEPTNPEPTKSETKEPEPAKPESTKPETAKSEPSQESDVEKIKKLIENETDPEQRKMYEQMLQDAEENEKVKDFKNINNVEIASYQDKKPVIKYTTMDGSKYVKGTQYLFEEGVKEKIIKDVLKTAYPEKGEKYFESNDGKSEIAKYEKADPNIINLLRYDSKRLEEYRDLLNGVKKRDKKDKDALNIVYDIRKLSKSGISKEEKEALKNYAFEHRKMAKVKMNLGQRIEFIFKAFKESITRSKDSKALASGISTSPVKDEGISNETKETLEQMMKDKKTREQNIKSMDEYVLSDEEKAKIDEKMEDFRKKAQEENERPFQNLPKEENTLKPPAEDDLSK